MAEEDLLSQLANPNRFAQLKERGVIDEKEIYAKSSEQDRAQNLRQGKPEQSSPPPQPVQEVKEEPELPPEQNTLAQFSQPEIEEPKVEVQPEPIQEVQQETQQGPLLQG